MRACSYLFLAAACFGQTTDFTRFEVATIRPFAGGVPRGWSGGPGTADPTRIDWSRITVKNLLANALNVPGSRVSGPAWLGSEYDLTAKLPPGATEARFRQMLANLLAERFGLKFHRVPKDLPGYELAVASGGPKFKPSSGTPPEGAPRPFRATFEDGVMHMIFQRSSLFFLVNRLDSVLGGGTEATLPLTDKTGLSGSYDFTLDLPIAPALEATDTAPRDPYVDPKTASALLEKQLGLTLKPIKHTVDFIVVDHLERTPTSN